jgi:hypothetical protein
MEPSRTAPSHLLGRLFKELDDRATLIYLRPFEDPQKCWHSILLQTVQELERTDNAGLESEANPRQIGAFANRWGIDRSTLLTRGKADEFTVLDHQAE